MQAAGVVALEWPARRRVALAALVAQVIVAVLLSFVAHRDLDIRGAAHEYNIGAWEVRHLGNKWLFLFGDLFRHGPSVTEEDALIGRFLLLTREIDDLEERISDASQRGEGPEQALLQGVAARRDERDRIENQVEATIEARLTTVLYDEDITRSLLLADLVWPPVDFEFTTSPRSLVTSYRDRIELKDTTLLDADLDLDDVERIEAETQAKEDVSALAFPTSGIGAYPTLVAYPTSYTDLLETVAHEWTHNYLFFRPLGFNYYDSYELRALNETVASLVGRELARLVSARWPVEELPPLPPRQAPTVDVIGALRELRAEVDSLLAAGQIEAAELLMERRREELVAQGAEIRKLNQAYFAFVNLYAGRSGSRVATNPIGPKVDQLRRRSESLAAFVRVAGGLSSVADLDTALQRLQSAQP